MTGDIDTLAWMAFAMGAHPGGPIGWLAPIGIAVGYGAGVLALVFAVVPPLGRWLAPRPITNSYARYITFERVRKDGVVETRDGWLAAVWRLEGVDHSALSGPELDQLHRARCLTLDQIAALADAQLELRLITLREHTPDERAERAGAQASLTRPLRAISERWDGSIVGRTYRNRCYVAAYARAGKAGEETVKGVGEIIAGGLSSYQPVRLSGAAEDGPLSLYGRIVAPVSRPAPDTAGVERDVSRLITTDSMAWFHDGRMRASAGAPTSAGAPPSPCA